MVGLVFGVYIDPPHVTTERKAIKVNTSEQRHRICLFLLSNAFLSTHSIIYFVSFVCSLTLLPLRAPCKEMSSMGGCESLERRQWQIGLSRHASLYSIVSTILNTSTRCDVTSWWRRRWCCLLPTHQRIWNEDKSESCENFFSHFIQFEIRLLTFMIFFFHAVDIYLSPIETHCSNIDYFPTIETGSDSEETTRLHLARGVIVLFVLSFLSVIFAFFTGLSGEKFNKIFNTKISNFQSFIFFQLLRMLETISWCNYCNCNSHAHVLSACKWCYGIVAHRWILREGKSRRWRIFPTMAKRKLMTRSRVHV